MIFSSVVHYYLMLTPVLVTHGMLEWYKSLAKNDQMLQDWLPGEKHHTSSDKTAVCPETQRAAEGLNQKVQV